MNVISTLLRIRSIQGLSSLNYFMGYCLIVLELGVSLKLVLLLILLHLYVIFILLLCLLCNYSLVEVFFK